MPGRELLVMPVSSPPKRPWTLRELGDLLLSLLPFFAIAVLATIGLVKARCRG